MKLGKLNDSNCFVFYEIMFNEIIDSYITDKYHVCIMKTVKMPKKDIKYPTPLLHLLLLYCSFKNRCLSPVTTDDDFVQG